MSQFEPIELRQMTPGGEPRWKWKLADAIAAAQGITREVAECHAALAGIRG